MKHLLSSLLLVASATCKPTYHGTISNKVTTNVPISRPSVTVKNGTLEGIHSLAYNQDFFLGIPYAQPPVGDLRFRSPLSINTSYPSIHQAIAYPPSCYGYGSDDWGIPPSEDCLYLNVIRPAGIPENASLPVGVWIHGGGLFEGSTADKRYNLSFIVQNSVDMGRPMIGISLQYRLSAWGFLGSQEALQNGLANIGFKDQRLCLHWIQENVAAFGGDPTKVTIWGESAGAQSVGAHLLAYGGRDDGLFRSAIAESGGPAVWFTYTARGGFNATVDQETSYQTLLNLTGCPDLTCLRAVPTETINHALNGTSTLLQPFDPIIDGDFIQKFPTDQLTAGEFVKVPLIIGTNTDEGTLFAESLGPNSAGVNTDAEFRTALAANGMSNTTVAALEVLYPNIEAAGIPSAANYSGVEVYSGSQYKRTAAAWGDMVLIAPRRNTALSWAAQNTTVYAYRFDIRAANYADYMGSTHLAEISFVFDNELGAGYATKPITNSTAHVAKLMSRSWVGFITELDPNANGIENAAKWPRFVKDEVLGVGKNLVFASDVAWVEWDDIRLAECKFINDIAKAQFGK